MLDQESISQYKGGILACVYQSISPFCCPDVFRRDEMGLGMLLPAIAYTYMYNNSPLWASGKTVQMIATMAMNMPDLDDACRTTLIVVPAALLQQVGCIW